MKKKVTYYRCNICGNIVQMVNDSGRPLTCCGHEMSKLFPGITDGSKEKHVPDYHIKDCTVTVNIGKEPHPMEKDHYIEWVELITDCGFHRRYLKPGLNPTVCFKLLQGENVEAVYEYCNQHGLWVKE